MPAERYPHMVYDCLPEGNSRQPGRPKSTFRHTYTWMLQHVLINGAGFDAKMAKRFVADMEVRAQDRKAWGNMISSMSFNARGTSSLPTRRSARLQNIAHNA